MTDNFLEINNTTLLIDPAGAPLKHNINNADGLSGNLYKKLKNVNGGIVEIPSGWDDTTQSSSTNQNIFFKTYGDDKYHILHCIGPQFTSTTDNSSKKDTIKRIV